MFLTNIMLSMAMASRQFAHTSQMHDEMVRQAFSFSDESQALFKYVEGAVGSTTTSDAETANISASISIIVVAIVEFVFQFLIVLLFAWIFSALLGISYALFAIAVFALFAGIGWGVARPTALKQLNDRSIRMQRRPLDKGERDKFNRFFLIGYLINIIITFVVLLAVGKVLNLDLGVGDGSGIIQQITGSQIFILAAASILANAVSHLLGITNASNLPYREPARG